MSVLAIDAGTTGVTALVVGEDTGGDRAERDRGGAVVLFQHAGRLPPIHVGKRDVQEDQIGQARGCELHAHQRISGFQHLVAGVLEHRAIDLALVRLVVDHQDRLLLHRCARAKRSTVHQHDMGDDRWLHVSGRISEPSPQRKRPADTI